MTYGKLIEHLDTCANTKLTCPMGCHEILDAHSWEELVTHYEQYCPNVWVRCVNCRAAHVREEKDAHLKKFCSNKITRCNQCNAKVMRKDLDAHIFTKCPATSKHAKLAFHSLVEKHNWEPPSLGEIHRLQ